MTDEFKLFWPTDSRRINQFFGKNPDLYRPFGLAGHEGLDLRAPTNANVYAAADGEVYFVGHPQNHPYGLLIRIKHEHQGKIYRTIYAHLQETFVQVGQRVTAGQRIGLADNTGNSFGSHLHLTLIIDGVQTPGYPVGIVDPWPYLQASASEPAQPLPPNTPPASGLTVYTLVELFLREQANTNATIVALLGVAEPLTVLGKADEARAKIGREGQWLQVQTASNLVGFVAAWFVEENEKSLPPSDIIVYPTMKLNVRAAGSLEAPVLGTVLEFEALTVFGDNDTIQSKIGKKDEWLQVTTAKGVRGFVAAAGVRLTGEVAARCGLTLYPTDILSVRARPTTDSNRLALVTPNDELNVLGDIDQAYQRVGQANEWLNVQVAGGIVGYVAAEYVQTAEQAAFAPSSPYITVYALAEVIVRAQTANRSPEVGRAASSEELYVIGNNLEEAETKIGQPGEWLYVELETGTRGWVEAEQLTLDPTV